GSPARKGRGKGADRGLRATGVSRPWPPTRARAGQRKLDSTDPATSGRLGRSTQRPPLLEAFAAVHGPALRGLEGNRRFLPALRAGRFRFGALVVPGARVLSALRFAGLAPLGLVLEALVGEKHLLASSEDKLCATFRAFQNLIVVFHRLLRRPALGA